MKKILLFSTSMIFLVSYAQWDTTHVFVKIFDPIPFIDSTQQHSQLVNQQVQEEDTNYRRIYFIHGLGGDASSWQRASDACWDPSLNIPGFPARKARVSRPEYTNSTLTTLNSAAYEVNSLIVNQAASDITAYSMIPQSAFIIAHSQGGMVTRSLVHQYMTGLTIPNFGIPFGGFVTFSSPLQGAQILNNRNQIEVLANDACRSLIKGPGNNLSFNILLKLFGKESASSTLCDIISYDLLPAFFTDYYENITNDYMVGASAITLFNQDVANEAYMNMPKVSIGVIEPRENILWRTGNWLIYNPNTPPPFEANDDWQFYNTTVHPLYLEYVSKVQQHNNQIILLSHLAEYINPFFTPTLHTLTMTGILYQIKRRNDWQQGVNWFNRVNTTWETIIGALDYQYTTNTMYVCQNCSGSYYLMTPLITCNQQECLNRNCRTIIPIPVTEVTPIYKENDGIVLVESAKNLPGATCIPPPINMSSITNYEGSSHMQIRNDAYLKRSLLKLFEGEYGSFFKTRTRN